jgi:hypothetical protein
MGNTKATAIALTAVLALSLAGCAGAYDSDAVPTAAPVEQSATAAPVEPEATEAPATAEPVAAANKLGTKVQVGTEQFITAAKTAEYKDKYLKPAKGSKYLAVLVTVEGISSEGSSYNPLYFTVRDAEGYEYNVSLIGKEPMLGASNDLAAGKTVKGWVTFEVPKTAEGLTLVYSPVMGLVADPVEIALSK